MNYRLSLVAVSMLFSSTSMSQTPTQSADASPSTASQFETPVTATPPSLAPLQTPQPKQPTHSQITPEQFYQPLGSKRAVEVAYLMIPQTSVDLTQKSSGTKVGEARLSGSGVGARFGYGITDSTAVGFQVIHSSAKQEVVPSSGQSASFQANGLEDIKLEVQHTNHGPTSNIYIGFSGSFSLEKGKAATATKEGTQYSGGFAISPRIGVSSTLAPSSTIGAYVGYSWKSDRVVNDNGSPSKDASIRGGNTFNARGLLEFKLTQSTLNISAGIDRVEATTTEISGVKETDTGRTDVAFGIGTKITLNESAKALLNYEAIMVSAQDLTSTIRQSNYTLNGISASVRVEF